MFRLDFGSSSRPASPPSFILKGHKLSPTAPRYSSGLGSRCSSQEQLALESGPCHLTVCTAERKAQPIALNTIQSAPERLDTGSENALKSDVTSLHLNGRLLTAEEVAGLTRVILSSPALQVVSLAYNRLGGQIGSILALGAATNGLLQVSNLTLSGNSLGDGGLGAIASAMELGGLPKLKHLDVSGNQLTTLAPLTRVAGPHRPLQVETLKAENNLIHDESVQALTAAIHDGHLTRLGTLWLGGNELSDPSLRCFGALLSEESNTLRTIHLSLNRFGYAAKMALEATQEASVAAGRPAVRLVW